MEELIKGLLDKKLIEYSFYEYISSENAEYEEFHSNIIKALIIKQNKRNEKFINALEVEKNNMLIIRSMLQNPVIKRAYNNPRFQESIQTCMDKLSGSTVEIASGNNELNNIRSVLTGIMDEQVRLEKERLNEIYKSVGTSVWDDFKDYFNSDEFLKIIMNE